MLQKLITSLALIVTFAFAQTGAVLHEISHYGEIVNAKKSSAHDKSLHPHICDICLSFSGVVNNAYVSHAVMPIIPAAFEVSFQHGLIQQQPATFTYYARAPPQLI